LLKKVRKEKKRSGEDLVRHNPEVGAAKLGNSTTEKNANYAVLAKLDHKATSGINCQ
jgi:hypothetical protein